MRGATVRLASHSSPLAAAVNGCIRDGRLADARKLLDDSDPRHGDVAAWNSMIAGHVRAGQFSEARDLFDQMTQRDAVSWNTMLAGLRRAGDPEGVLRYFLRMGRAGVRPTGPTMATAVAAAAQAGAPARHVPQLHAVVAQSPALSSNQFVGTALVNGYAGVGDPAAMRQVFSEMPEKNAVAWTKLINGYMEMGCISEARRAFDEQPVKNTFSWTVMVNGYIRNGDVGEAHRWFDGMPTRNVVAWTSVINGYVRSGHFSHALHMFVEMLSASSAKPNIFTYSAILGACTGICSLLLGESVHSNLLKSGMPADIVLLSSLIQMYAKCGNVGAAIRVFESIERNNLISWNLIIGCCARHGLCSRALEEFEKMKASGIAPDWVTFVCVLSACMHGGLVEEGEQQFESMQGEFGIHPRMEHYACMVDLFGRAGQLEKAEQLIREMPFEPDVIVLGALASACGLHSSLEHGLPAAELMRSLEGEHPAIHTMLMRAHGDRGLWSKVQEVKESMEGLGRRKQKGASWIAST